MSSLKALLLLAPLALATITITDPSDAIPSADWTSDNAILADYEDATIMYQYIAVTGPYVYDGQNGSISHAELYVDANDTSVVVVANDSSVSVDWTTITKFGYSSDLLQASFFGVNGAVVVANESTASLKNVNITTHNGAANIYSYGTGTVVDVDHAWLYSSGPVSHGMYASGNGTIYGKNVVHYSGGNRCSSFSGDSPAGYIHIQDSVAHTDGIGSAVCYALGLCNLTNVVGHASRSPVMFMDGAQEGIWTNCDVTAGLLGGTVMFGSSSRSAGGIVTFDHSKLTILGDTMPAFWFGNTIATAEIIASQINVTASGILSVANYSQVTQDFDYYASYTDNNDLLPAEATLIVKESAVDGDIVAYNGSSIAISLAKYSSWEGATVNGYGTVTFGVTLDKTSNWTLTANSEVLNFTDADTTLSNVFSNGFNITYNSSSTVNSKWNSSTISLSGGGYFTPS